LSFLRSLARIASQSLQSSRTGATTPLTQRMSPPRTTPQATQPKFSTLARPVLFAQSSRP
jgi:hypothetical protein